MLWDSQLVSGQIGLETWQQIRDFMTLLKGLNFTLLISGPQVGLVYQNPYQPLRVGKEGILTLENNCLCRPLLLLEGHPPILYMLG